MRRKAFCSTYLPKEFVLDAESWKTVISTASAIIAVASAFLAYRARIQTRTDIFEGQRDALILTMAGNDNRASHLMLQSAFARQELNRLLPTVTNAMVKEQFHGHLSTVAEIEKMTSSLDGREYNARNLEALKYSEAALAILRQMSRGEQVNAKHLTAESYDLIFRRVENFILRHEGQA